MKQSVTREERIKIVKDRREKVLSVKPNIYYSCGDWNYFSKDWWVYSKSFRAMVVKVRQHNF